jgi:hypothetical protein
MSPAGAAPIVPAVAPPITLARASTLEASRLADAEAVLKLRAVHTNDDLDGGP